MLGFGKKKATPSRPPDQYSEKWMARNALTIVADFFEVTEKHSRQETWAPWAIRDVSTLPHAKPLIDVCLRFVWFSVPEKRQLAEKGMMLLSDYQENVGRIAEAEKLAIENMARQFGGTDTCLSDEFDEDGQYSPHYRRYMQRMALHRLNAEIEKSIHCMTISKLRASKSD